LKRVELDDFSGPLDLLLTLVQQEEVSLTRIHLIEVLNQVLDNFGNDLDLNESGDLLMIISTLMELKSKLLLPGEVDIGEEIQALKEDLLAKVLVHRRLSQVLDALEYRWDRRQEMMGRPSLLMDKETVMKPLEQQNPFLLFTSLSGLLEQARQDKLRVSYHMQTIDHYFKWLEADWVGRESFTLKELIHHREDLLDGTGVIIAVLEFVRLGKLAMEPISHDVEFRWGDPEAKRLELEEMYPEADALAFIGAESDTSEPVASDDSEPVVSEETDDFASMEAESSVSDETKRPEKEIDS
jgi:segregation and condensation protein A